jgi:hypothetical protein
MELFDVRVELEGHVVDRNPGVVIAGVSFPSNEVVAAIADASGVEEILDLEPRCIVIVEMDRGWRWGDAPRNRGGSVVGFEKGSVERGVEARHGRRKVEPERPIAARLQDPEWPELSIVELLGWALRLDVATTKPDEGAGLESGWVLLHVLVVLSGLILLSVLEFGAKFGDERVVLFDPPIRRGDNARAVWNWLGVWMETVVGEEG